VLGAAGDQDPAVGFGQRGHGRRDPALRVLQRGGQHDLDLVGVRADPRVLAGRRSQAQPGAGPGGGGGPVLALVEAQGLAQRGDPLAQRGGQDALDLGQRGVDAGHGMAEAFGGQQPDDHRGGLVVGEHQGRQAVAGQQAVAAVAAAFGGDRDAEISQAERVPADRPLVHAEPGGQFGAGQLATGLEQLQHGQHPSRRM
jgi:hypothetical protein